MRNSIPIPPLEIKPFIFHVMPDEYAHLCVVRAYLKWILVSSITEGYVFRKMRANDRIAEENEPMVSSCLYIGLHYTFT